MTLLVLDSRLGEWTMNQTFRDYNFKSFIYQALDAINFKEPRPIQSLVIPKIKENRDLIVKSVTGSGKTHAFLLPMVNKINPKQNHVQVLITAPSRELAGQLYQAALQLTKYSQPQIRVSEYVGGTDKNRQLDKLSHQQPHIAIGTPGRLMDMINTQALLIHQTNYLVIDEGDMTMDLGFLTEMDQIASRVPADAQISVFSATIPESLQSFLKKYMTNPNFLEAEGNDLISDYVQNWLISTKGVTNRTHFIYELLTVGQPYLALIFANTKNKVQEIAEELSAKGLKVGVIHGGLEARERKKMMRQIRNLDYQYVVATDLAARGIDIEGVSHVVNAELPTDLDFFIHRVGRTGRNQLEGIAITLYSPDEEELISELENRGIKFTPKSLKGQEIVDTYDRNRRALRKDTSKGQEYDPEIASMVRKAKKKVKPGYKRKIAWRKKEKNRKKNRQNNRKR